MGKYGNIINEAKKGEPQNAGTPESQKAIKPEYQKDGKTEYQKTGIPERIDFPEEVVEEMVNLSIKVPKSLRQHWAAESKRQGTSLTAAITDALVNRFGKPES